jgi:DENN (AEX-3) domain/dDENN domain
MLKIHYFVATGGTGKTMYGTCLTLWEPYTISGRKKNAQEGEGGRTEHDVFLPKCVVILSTYPYLMAFREYLTQLNRLSKLGEMTVPIERYITNICCEIPAPPPGSFEVQTTILDSIIKIWSPPHNQPIAWVSLPFSHLFECLDVENIILVWRCLVLERQVLLTSTQLSILTTCSEIFLSLLFPMRWSHAYIPVVPCFMIPILSAPMPFLCGINKANLAEALYDLSPECVVVDLDKNLVTLGPNTEPLPPLPPQQEACLRTQLEENAGMVFREARSLTKNDDYSDSGSRLPTHVKQMAEAMWEGRLSLFDEAFHLMFTPEEARKNLLNGNDTFGMEWNDHDMHDPLRRISVGEKSTPRRQSEWDAVQEAFLDTFVYLLRNYRRYLIFPSKHNEGSYGGAGFRSKEFIESQRFDMRGFLEQFIGTQMFDNFVTKRLYGSGEADVAFFDLAVDRFLKNAGILSNVDVGGRLLHATGLSSQSDRKGSKGFLGGGFSFRKDIEPLLQSARVHQKLKTIVPPEPCMEGLPPMAELEGISAVSEAPASDEVSLGSTSTSSRSQVSDAYKSVQDKAAEILGKKKLRYKYDEFPSQFRDDLFAVPRPLPAAVIAEFDRQKKDAAQFRRKKTAMQPNDKRLHIQRAHATLDPVSPQFNAILRWIGELTCVNCVSRKFHRRRK